MSVPTGGSTSNPLGGYGGVGPIVVGTGGSMVGFGGGSMVGFGGSMVGFGGSMVGFGGSMVGTGGLKTCTSCNALPSCDFGDTQVTADQCINSALPCYGRSLCCSNIICMPSSVSATGGAASVATGGAKATTGGSYGTGGKAAMSATGGKAPSYPNANCTYGQDQTCNDDLLTSSLWGACDSSGWCICNSPFLNSPSTGKCTTYDQTVCYSPTQNIDKAYVDRAFGCKCDANSVPTKPFCTIDSSGLRVYLYCTSSNVWQSGDTSNCN